MSYNSTADEKIDLARDSVQTALEALGEVVLMNCSGSDDYKTEFKQGLRQSMNLLLEVRDLIGIPD